MTDVVVIAAAADQNAALALVKALADAGISAEVKTAAGPAPPKSQFMLFCVTKAALKDSPLIGMVWRETPMSEDPTGRFLFAVFDESAAADDNFAPFLKRHFHAPGGDAQAFAAHVIAHQAKLAEAARAAEVRIEEIMREAAARPPSPAASAPREGIGSAREPDRPMGVGAASPADNAQRERFIEAMQRKRAAEQAVGNPPLHSLDKMMEAPEPPPSASAPASAQSSVRYSAREKAPPGKLDRVDARAFAPKKLRRGTSELIRVAVFQPKDKGRAMREAKQADARTNTAGAAQHLGKIERGAMIAAVIDARGADVEATRIEARRWISISSSRPTMKRRRR